MAGMSACTIGGAAAWETSAVSGHRQRLAAAKMDDAVA